VSARGETRIEDPTAGNRPLTRRVAEARATIPDLELSVEVDVSHATVSTARLIHACARALRDVPRANGTYRDGRFELYERVNVGVVLAREDGHVIPTVFDADTKTLEELSDELAALLARAGEGALPAPALAGATFTLWDAAELGLDRAGIVVGPGQAAALVAGAVRDVPLVRDGALVPGRTITITLACDHRILYGAQAAAFLRAVKSSLEGP
jgi:pyruvate dehydrogenase E2 component (dihydrolipoyllysine-residue acetyltransferase)